MFLHYGRSCPILETSTEDLRSVRPVETSPLKGMHTYYVDTVEATKEIIPDHCICYMADPVPP